MNMKDHNNNGRKVYTKSDYIYIYSKLGLITSTFAAVSMSLALFLGFVITFINHDLPDLSSLICLILFVLNLPMVFRNIRRYHTVQKKLRGNHPYDAEDIVSKTILPNKKQLWGGIILLAVLAFVILFLCFLMLWLMISFYENIFLVLFIFLGALTLPVLAVMVIYIRLLPFADNLHR